MTTTTTSQISAMLAAAAVFSWEGYYNSLSGAVMLLEVSPPDNLPSSSCPCNDHLGMPEYHHDSSLFHQKKKKEFSVRAPESGTIHV